MLASNARGIKPKEAVGRPCSAAGVTRDDRERDRGLSKAELLIRLENAASGRPETKVDILLFGPLLE